MGTKLAGSPNPTAAELLDAAVTRWTDLPSRTLARKLFNDHKGMWPTLEVVCQAIRYRRGRHGNQHRRTRSGAANMAPSSAPSIPWNPEGFIPPADEESFEPHIVEVDRDALALVLNDIHVPFHDTNALKVALASGKKKEADIVQLNGDTLDFYRLSRFLKDPTKRNAKKEIDIANQLLDAIDDMFPRARKIWKDGNHDERYEHYVMAHAAELYEVVKEKCSLDKLLELEARGWEYVTDRRPIYLGKLPVIHGHEYPTPVLGPVNAARGLFLRTKNVALVGHHHQTSEHTETTIKGDIITTWSVACLCGLHPYYARFNKWNHGFAEVEIDSRGDFAVHNHRIHDGKVLN